jgi:uncharacterized Zn finger protein
MIYLENIHLNCPSCGSPVAKHGFLEEMVMGVLKGPVFRARVAGDIYDQCDSCGVWNKITIRSRARHMRPQHTASIVTWRPAP